MISTYRVNIKNGKKKLHKAIKFLKLLDDEVYRSDSFTMIACANYFTVFSNLVTIDAWMIFKKTTDKEMRLHEVFAN